MPWDTPVRNCAALTVRDIDPAFPNEVWPAHWEELRQKKSFVIESQHRTKNGDLIPVEIAVNHIEFGGREYNCAFARNITERNRMEQELWAAKEHYRILADNVDDVIWTADMKSAVDLYQPLDGEVPRLYGGGKPDPDSG